MKIIKELEVKINSRVAIVYFGHPDTEKEKEEMFRFRFNEYSRCKYIDPSRFSNGQEQDDYDNQNKCVYFIAIVDGKIIGTIRLILDNILPTEQDFSFSEPKDMKVISRDERGELGRLIIVPYDRDKKIFFPRGIIMLMLLSTLIDYGLNNQIVGGYAFVKSTLKRKMLKLRLPAHFISPYKQDYPENGILFNYFNQPEDPVVPMYFITKEFKMYIDRVFSKKWFFKIIGNRIVIKNTILTKLLIFLRIL